MDEAQHAGREPLVLVADDDPLVRKLASAAMRAEGLGLAEARDGVEALSAAREREPDLVLLDVQMPGKDGFAVLEELRRDPQLRFVPVLVMTGSDDHESIERAYAVGATDFIVKPIQWTILRHRVRYMIRASEQLAQLQASERALATAQRIAQLGSWTLAADGSFRCSEEVLRIFSIPGTEPELAATIAARVHPDDRDLVNECIREASRAHRSFTTDYRLALPDGARSFVHMEARAVRSDGGELLRLEGILQDVTARKKAEEDARYLAHHDSLTGLANRRLLVTMLERNIAEATAAERALALLCIDLDNFKQINDSLGHPIGDLVLKEVGERLCRSVRNLDRVVRPLFEEDNTPVARNGGDEFTIVLGAIGRAGDAARVSRRILDEIARPIAAGENELHVAASIGIAVFPDDATTGEGLMRNADTALYHAKAEGRGRYHFYDPAMNRAARRRLEIHNRLGRALESGELTLHYQPRVEPGSRRMVGMEALARWTDPELGRVNPGEFVPVADESLLLRPFSEWSLYEACTQMRRWVDAGIAPGPTSVNVSPRLFRDSYAAELVEKVLVDTGLEPRYLEIEITENALLEDTEVAAEQLRRLREHGVRIAIDDFGTGYSSLRYLSHLELDTLKIDRSLVERLAEDRQSALIIDAVVSMCSALGLTVVAEGVESEEQLAALYDRGCDEVQGFLISRALPAAEIEELLWP